jgi:hypothetical protein
MVGAGKATASINVDANSAATLKALNKSATRSDQAVEVLNEPSLALFADKAQKEELKVVNAGSGGVCPQVERQATATNSRFPQPSPEEEEKGSSSAAIAVTSLQRVNTVAATGQSAAKVEGTFTEAPFPFYYLG